MENVNHNGYEYERISLDTDLKKGDVLIYRGVTNTPAPYNHYIYFADHREPDPSCNGEYLVLGVNNYMVEIQTMDGVRSFSMVYLVDLRMMKRLYPTIPLFLSKEEEAIFTMGYRR